MDYLTVLRCRWHIIATDSTWPRYKGFGIHSALGPALRNCSPEAYACLYGDSTANTNIDIKPYRLLPPLNQEQDVKEGDLMHIDLALFGPASRWLFACMSALETVGKMGIERGQGRFEIQSVEAWSGSTAWHSFYQTREGVAEWPRVLSVKTILEEHSPQPATTLDITLDTPLRLKQENRLQRSAPSFSDLMRHLATRVKLLSESAGLPPLISSEEKTTLLSLADSIEPANHEVNWTDLSRYSFRQKANMQFGGIMGTLRYSGEHLGAFRPWLALAECVHLGGKTTFGLGHINPHFKS